MTPIQAARCSSHCLMTVHGYLAFAPESLMKAVQKRNRRSQMSGKNEGKKKRKAHETDLNSMNAG